MLLFKSPLFRLTSCCIAERNMLFNDVDGERLMFDWFQKLWHWTIEPVPLLLALAIYFGPIFYRRWRYFAYVPLYFSIYPLSRIKSDVVNKYIGSTYYPPFLEDEDEAEKLREKTLLVISVSIILDTIIIPACVAFIWSLFLDAAQFITALATFLSIQAFRFVKSIVTLHKHTYGTPRFRGWLIAGYAAALIFMCLAMLETWIPSRLLCSDAA